MHMHTCYTSTSIQPYMRALPGRLLGAIIVNTY